MSLMPPGAYVIEMLFPRERCGRCGVELVEYLPAYRPGFGLICMDCDRALRLFMWVWEPQAQSNVVKWITEGLR